MSDQDIVARLRANLSKYPGFVNLNEEAAAEIERLRKQVAVLREECRAWRTADSQRWVLGKEDRNSVIQAINATDAAGEGK